MFFAVGNRDKSGPTSAITFKASMRVRSTAHVDTRHILRTGKALWFAWAAVVPAQAGQHAVQLPVALGQLFGANIVERHGLFPQRQTGFLVRSQVVRMIGATHSISHRDNCCFQGLTQNL